MILIDMDHLRRWIGRTEQSEDIITLAPAVRLAAMLNYERAPAEGESLPSLWHWLYFTTTAAQSELGRDGHPELGGFMPPIPLPRRMTASGELRFPGLIRIGDRVSQRTEITDMSLKNGRQGPLMFVTLTHHFSVGGNLVLVEHRNLVYRPAIDAPPVAENTPASRPESLWEDTIMADEVLLFRYSALTFNAHRIHYDASYAREEGYPGLVVQGPLTATLLADRLRARTGATLNKFSFRGRRPLFAGAPIVLRGKEALGDDRYDLWAETPGGHVAMEASARIESR